MINTVHENEAASSLETYHQFERKPTAFKVYPPREDGTYPIEVFGAEGVGVIATIHQFVPVGKSLSCELVSGGSGARVLITVY